MIPVFTPLFTTQQHFLAADQISASYRMESFSRASKTSGAALEKMFLSFCLPNGEGKESG